MVSSSQTTRRLVRIMCGVLALGMLAQQSVSAAPPAPPGGGARPPADGIETTTKTLILHASTGQLATAWATHSSRTDVYYVPVPVACPPSTRGTGDLVIAPDEIVVGYNNYYDPGTDPFPCREKIDTIMRGTVSFSLDGYTSIKSKWLVKARLTYRLRGSDVRDEPGTYGVSHPISCATQLDLAMASPFGVSWEDMTKTEGYTGLPASREGGTGNFAIDVTAAVNRMAAYPDAYHGFVLIGDESRGDNNRACLSRYGDFQLTLEYVLGTL